VLSKCSQIDWRLAGGHPIPAFGVGIHDHGLCRYPCSSVPTSVICCAA
jgi:hypothetical protein